MYSIVIVMLILIYIRLVKISRMLNSKDQISSSPEAELQNRVHQSSVATKARGPKIMSAREYRETMHLDQGDT